MNFFIECQINTTGKSKELNIPSGFRMGIPAIRKEIQEDDTANVIFEVCTYKDGAYSERIKNDDIPWRKPYNMPKAEACANKTDVELFNDYLKPDVIAKYGAGNIQVL